MHGRGANTEAAGGPRKRRLRAWLVVAGLWLCTTGVACLGPTAIKQTRLRYNEAYRQTNDEQLLLNIVRLRYADSPVFIDLSNIASQFESGATGGFSGGLDGQGPGPTRLGMGELVYRDAPTLSYQPREGNDVGKELLTPLVAELLRLFSPGASFEQFMLLGVNDINDISNASIATGLTPQCPDDNTEFRHILRLIVALQYRHEVELSVAKFEDDPLDPIPVTQVKGADVLEAAQHGYVFRVRDGGASLHKTEKSLTLKVLPKGMNSPEWNELVGRLGLEPGRTYYRLRTEQNEDESEDELPSPLGSDTILLNMRSMLEMLTFLSKGVVVPEAHVRDHIAPTTVGPDGRPYDWTRITAGAFRVCHSEHRPKNAEVAVQYRGYWFYIDEADTASRAVLAILEIVHALEESNVTQAGPLLTLPIN